MFDFEERVLIGWLVRVFASQPIKTRDKSQQFCFYVKVAYVSYGEYRFTGPYIFLFFSLFCKRKMLK